MTEQMAMEVIPSADHAVLRLTGSLSLATALEVREALGKQLAARGRVVVELSGVTLDWPPALELFPTALSTSGGWPWARLALYQASPPLATAFRRTRAAEMVPLEADHSAAVAALDIRPRRVSRHRDLPCDLGAAAAARTFLRQACTDWDAGELAELAVLVGNEFVSNVVEHADTSCRLTASLDRRGMRVAVRDFHPSTAPRPRPISVGARRGRGLHLVAQLAANWGVTDHPDGKTVWATVVAPASASSH
jgi:anti-sigma regulatory factor (Ser/Thr protein kinase)